ncbi:MAG TPA: ABC transporter permease [Pyrinomonadaceae bacterium]|nr:ABC transporter permease [Pyrinomonadaceae bacterium]
MRMLWQDIRFGVRMLLKNWSFTLVVVLSLAFGIGANTAIFSIVDVALLKQLPVRSPEQLVMLDTFNERGEQRDFSHPLFEQMRARNKVFSGMFAAMDGTRRMDVATESAQLGKAEVQLVSGEYFDVLGVNAFLGRTLTPSDDQTPGAHPVAVLSYGFWQRAFAGDNSIIGQTVRLKDQPFTVIGVTPRAFFGESVGRAPDIWSPLMMEPTLSPGQSYLREANVNWLRVLARCQSGTCLQQAQSELNNSLAQVKNEPDPMGREARRIARLEVTPGGQGLAEFRTQFGKPLQILMAAVILVLLIACANVANLLLARATSRQKEVAVRMAIGAGRFRLIRQFLTESFLLAFVGGLMGLLLAWWGTRILLVLASASSAPIPLDVEPNRRILAFTLAISVATAIISGLAPAIIVTRQRLTSALKTSTMSRPRLWLSRPLVIAQVALSVLLLTGAGLFVQTLRNLRAVDLGFAVDELVQVRINPEGSGYKPDQLPQLYSTVLERISSTPGVRSASMAATGFRSGMSRTCCIAIEGRAVSPDEDREVQTINVTPGYFQTMGLTLQAGRDFTWQETPKKDRGFGKVAVINKTLAQQYFGNSSPLGQHFGWGDPAKESVKYDIEIVGVANDAKYGKLREKTRPLIYFPTYGGTLLVVRGLSTTVSPEAIRQQVQSIDRSLEILTIQTVPRLVDFELSQERLLAKLSSFFSAVALLLACLGLYAVISYDVGRRTHEFGIRIALGAQTTDVLRMVMKYGIVLVLVGIAIGLGAAFAFTRVLASLLFGVTPTDAATLAIVSFTLVSIALIACYLPARRATKVDP